MALLPADLRYALCGLLRSPLISPRTTCATSCSTGSGRAVGRPGGVPILSGREWDSSMSVEGHQPSDGEDMQAYMNALSPGYFTTMRIPILEGRDFTRRDAAEKPRVAIVNRRFAEHFFPGGRRLGFGLGPGN